MNEEVRNLSAKTPQLDLLMKDPTLDGHEYFNVKTMMNDNWEKIDKFAGEAKASIENLEDRLNTKAEEEVVLNAGVQIVKAARSAPFSLKGLEGRTLVNLLGRMGKGDSASGWGIPIQATLSIDTTNSAEGSSCIKVVSTATSGESFVGPSLDRYIPVTAGNYYLVVGMIKVITGSAWLRPVTLVDNTSNASATGDYGNVVDKVTDTSKFVTVQFKFKAAANSKYLIVRQQVSAGGSAYFKAIRVHEVSAAEFAALDGMKTDQIAEGYPYVDSVTPVRNPYAIRYGENLLPSFYDWSASISNTGGLLLVDSPYSASFVARPSGDGIQTINYYTTVPVVPGKTYVYSMEHDGVIGINGVDKYGNVVTVSAPGFGQWLTDQSITVTVPDNVYALRLMLGNNNATGSAHTYKNPKLNIGSEALPFVPREDAILSLQTDLFADPVTGANADSVFEQGGQYFKAKKWRRVVLDGFLPWELQINFTGFKQVGISSITPLPVSDRSAITVKYDGKILTNGTLASGPDITNGLRGDDGLFSLSVSNSDSGWDDNYTPSADEIKAYFLGWYMYTAGQNPTSQASGYNGTGTKVWTPQLARDASNFVSTVPTTQASSNWTPYELVYQLATPTVEPIVSEGQLTFNEGSNQVEVGTGIVLREGTRPGMSGYSGDNVYYINSKAAGNPLKYIPSKLLSVFADSEKDRGWGESTNADANGPIRFYKSARTFDKTKTYSVTYLMLATSPIQPMTGAYAGNEKSLLEDLVDSVTQQEIRLSVVENKKAEKDYPAWITPTLLNGWTSYSDQSDTTGYRTAQYYKDSTSRVYLRGLISSGTSGSIAAGTILFTLPPGFRPKYPETFIVAQAHRLTQTTYYSRVTVRGDGTVVLASDISGGNTDYWLQLFGISFLAEQ
ncbi:hypothetical protein [Paenibacillus jiagnxiensis]|uniref:hypothetical protein n=1 Tax=Paenibacillus jiagnxiensis TaxID=3228926 RepID=UPI0038D43A42